MTALIHVIETALPVLAALLLGMFCRETQFLTRDGVDTLKKVDEEYDCLEAKLKRALVRIQAAEQ